MGIPNNDNETVETPVADNNHNIQLKPQSVEINRSDGDDHGAKKTEEQINNDNDDSSVGDSSVDADVDDHDSISSNSDGGSVESDNKKEKEEENGYDSGDVEQTVTFPPELPKPEPPPGILVVYTESDQTVKTVKTVPEMKRSNSSPENSVQIPAIGKYFREKSNSLSAAITKRLNSLTDDNNNNNNNNGCESEKNKSITEINLSGLKVTVKLKDVINEGDHYKGRITFFSRSNCRDSTAVRTYFRDRNLKYIEINIDVYPTREVELIERTGSTSVPQIFFNEKLFGGLVTLNSLRNCGLLEDRMRELLRWKCGEDGPVGPVYGFDEVEEEKEDEMVVVVRGLRQRLPIQDRLMKMKIVRNCFSAGEMVEVLIQQFDCGRKKAVEMGKQIARRHFIHHVFGENEFEDGNHFYRFLEHEPFIPRCYNFRGSTNDLEPKAATFISQKLAKIMSAILETYASEDGCHLDYLGISNSEEFRRYVNLMQELQRVDISTLSVSERLAFFLNLHNAMVIHGVISLGHPGSAVIDRRSFNSDFVYIIGGSPYSLTTIINGVLRNNRRAPYSFTKSLASGDKRLEQLAFPKVNPLIHFGICNGSKSSPPVRFFTPQGIESELRFAAREFLQRDGIQVDLAKRTVHLTRIFKWFSADFGTEKEILKWITGYLDSTKAGLLSHLASDGGAVHVVYQDYDWSINC